MTKFKKILTVFISLFIVVSAFISFFKKDETENTNLSQQEVLVEEDYYYQVEEVALYIHQYHHLPNNYLTKQEAISLGWDNTKGNLWEVAKGKVIGGDIFVPYEDEDVAKKEGRTYQECDVNYNGGYRGAERLVFSNDGLIYYTKDHYTSFTLLYGEE